MMLQQIFNTTGPGYRWYLNDQLHCETGPAVVKDCGERRWIINGQLHRVCGPAIEFAGGHEYWYLNGLRHRIGGPALMWTNGYNRWFINGVQYSEREYDIMSFLQSKTPEHTRTTG